MAEEEDDDGFGTFTFASFNPSTKSSPQITTATVDDDDDADADDEWGDFVRTPLGSLASSTTATPAHSSSVDPLHTLSLQPESGNSIGPQSSGWVKLKGAIPLSIFGEIEEDKEDEVEGSGTDDAHHTDGKDSKINGSLGVPFNFNSITSLYNNSGASMHKRSESESGRISSSGSVHGKNENEINGMSSDLNALDLDFSGWSSDFNTNSNDHSLQCRDEIGDFQFSSNGIEKDASHSLFDAVDLKSHDMESKSYSNGVHMAVNFNGNGGNEQDGDGDGDDGDYDEWEFKDADTPTRVSQGLEKVRNVVEKISGDNAVSKLENGPDSSTNLFTTSNGKSDTLFISSVFPSKTNWPDIGLGITSSNSIDNNFSWRPCLNGEQTGNMPMPDPHIAVESAESDEDFGDFAAAYGGLEADSKGHQIPEINASSLGFNGLSAKIVHSSADNQSFDLFLPANNNSSDPIEVSVGYDINPIANGNDGTVHGGYAYDTPLRSEQIEGQHLQESDLVIQSAEPNDDFGEFTETWAQNEPVRQEKEIILDQRKGALPLSIFGDEEEEVDGSSNANGDFNILQPASSKGNVRAPNSSTSINDLITNLYSQAEHISSSSSLHTPVVNGLDQSDSGAVSNPVNCFDDDDNVWEFTDSFSHDVQHIEETFPENENAHKRSSGKLKIQSCLDFYSKLEEELYFIAKVHLISLKETENTASSGEDENGPSLVAEIQEACKELSPENEITREDDMGNHTSRDVTLNELVEILHKPKFHVLQAEYNLERIFLQVENDARSLLQLIYHTKSMLKILSLGSLEDQSSYVSIWSKMIFACAQEMRHGSLIWSQALQKNILSQILAEDQGKTFVLSLGEIYRAAVLLGATVKLYKPWILSSNVELSRLYSLLEECHSSWSSSGLKEAFSSVLEAALTEDPPSHSSLLDSIKYISDLDDFTLQNHVFIQKEATCRLSLLTPSVMPGTSLVAWDGEQCFLRLANLWVNLVSSDHPKLPPILVNG